MNIRKSSESDLMDLLKVETQAFGNEKSPVIAKLVSDLSSDPTARPLLSLIAEKDDQVMGHILFSKGCVDDDAKDTAQAAILAPRAVRPDQQRIGVGGGSSKKA